jgi:hypothetical protein
MQFDGARPNLFEVTLNFPGFSTPGNAATKTRFMCKSASLPGSTVGVVPVQYFGREVKFAGNRTFPDWTITVINDEDFSVRNAFERWMNAINSHRGNLRQNNLTNPNSYITDASVTHYGKAGDSIKSYKFFGLFPSDIAPIDLDWGNNDTMEEFTVTLQYQWWESIKDSVY